MKKNQTSISQDTEEKILSIYAKSIVSCIDGEPEISEVPIDKDVTGKHRAEKIIGIPGESTSLFEGLVKYDVIFKAKVPNQEADTELIINIEAQKKFNPGYSLVMRGIYYCARMLSDQKGSEFAKSDYNGIKKVHSIWICLHPAKGWEGTITTYQLKEKNIKGLGKGNPSTYDKLQITMICLGKPDTEDGEGLLDMLETLFVDNISDDKRKEKLKQYGVYDNALEREVNDMCNYGEYMEERGIEKGMQQGELKGQFKTILALRETLFNGDLEKIMDMVKIPQKDRAYFREEIQKLEKQSK